MKIDFIRSSYQRFYSGHKKEIDSAISKCLSRGSLIMESEVERFEKNFAKFCERKYCITTSSGTEALKLACKDRKINYWNDYRYRLPFKNEKKWNAILTTYMNSVENYIIDTTSFIIEDACQAVGRYLIGDISCFSFYPAKMIGGIGKGGALVMNDENIYKKLKAIRDDKWNNLWLDEIQACFLNVKLKYLPKLLKQRQKITDYYNKNLPQDIIWKKKCLQNYIVIVKEHDKFIKFMRSKGIEVISDKSDFYEGNLKNAIRIPIYAELKLSEAKYIVDKIKQFYDKK